MTTERLSPSEAAVASASRSLRSRIRAGIAVLLIPLALVIGVAEFTLLEAQRGVEAVAQEAIGEVLPLAQLEARIESIERLGVDALVGGDAAEDLEAYEQVADDIGEGFAELEEASVLVEDDRSSAANAWRLATQAVDLAVESRRFIATEDDPAVAAFTRPLHESRRELKQAIRASEADSTAAIARARRLRRMLTLGLILIAAVSVGIVLMLGRRLTRSIAIPIAALRDGTRRFSSGDLAHRITVPRDDELGELAAALNGMAGELVTQHDELEQSRQRLSQSQKLEAVGQLAGGIAHDFNNLLLIVGSYAGFLHESFEEDDPRRSDVDEIRRASDRAAALTRQLLTFSRRGVTQPVPLNAATTISQLEPMLRRTLPATVTLELELEQGLRATVIDPGQLEQAVLNLVLNARNAMPDGGDLTVRASSADVDEGRLIDGVPPGAYVAIVVSDTGEGMSEAVRDRALEPFFTTRGDAGGSGLGLATVFGIVTAAGGAITIESAPAEGTTVTLYLPTTTASAPAPAEEEAPRPRAPGNDNVVLLAEDEETVRALTTRILSIQGYKVLAAATGAGALELARDTDRIDVLLTDAVMPGMTGGALAAVLQQERPGLRTVYMSGYSDQIVAENGVLDAGTLYLQKPFKPQELLNLLEQALAGGP